MLEKRTEIKIEIVGQFRAVQVLEAVNIYEDDKLVSGPSYTRWVIQAGDDYSKQPAEVQAVCEAVHTMEVVAAKQASVS